MINKVKMLTAAAAVATLPVAAFAVPVEVNADVDLSQAGYSFSTTVNPGDDGAVFTFTVLEALSISGIVVSGSSTNGSADITSTTFQVVNPDTAASPFQNFTLLFGTGGGSAAVEGQDYASGDTFSVTFEEDALNPISYTVSFPVAEVPVPAAGLLLLGALGGFAGLRRRKKA